MVQVNYILKSQAIQEEDISFDELINVATINKSLLGNILDDVYIKFLVLEL